MRARSIGPSASRRSAAAAASRRAVLKLGAGCALAPLVGLRRVAVAQADDLPRLDGELRVDDAARSAVATDYGGAVRRAPRAVARVRSVEDVVRVVAHANRHGLKLAMRGQGHSLSGQALIEDGIVIDSAGLAAIGPAAGDALDAQPGARWGDVATAALARGRLPPVMPDAMMLTVGGTLSAGGIGETSWRHGAQVDHAGELDVVTGAGDLVTCSATREPELFAMTLAGMGQCGIIVRARLALAATAGFVATRTFTYTDLDAFLVDQARLTDSTTLGLLNGRVIRTPRGGFEFALTAGSFVAAPEEASRAPDWMDGLRLARAAPPVAAPIWSYLDRRTAGIAAGPGKATPSPSLIVTLPAEATAPFITHVLASPQLSAGIWFFEVSAKVPLRHTRPLQRMPLAAIAYELRIAARPRRARPITTRCSPPSGASPQWRSTRAARSIRRSRPC